jgi:PAS domain S-box-containing protein
MQPGGGEQMDLFRLLVESVRDYAIFHLDPQGHIRSWNAGAQRIKGYAASEIIGKHFSIFYPPAEIRRGKPEYELRVAIDEGRYEEEGWRVRKDGTRFWASVVITALRMPDQTLVGFAKVTRDLTERKQAEEERARLLDLERAARSRTEAALERLRSIQQVTEAALAHLSLDDLLHELLEQISEIQLVDIVTVLLVDPTGTRLIPEAITGLPDDLRTTLSSAGILLGEGIVGRIASERQGVVFDDLSLSARSDPFLSQLGLGSLIGAPLGVEGRIFGVLLVGTRHYRRFVDADLDFLQIVADRVALAIDRARLYEAEQTARREAAEASYAIRLRDEFLSVASHELRNPVAGIKGAAQLLRRAEQRGQLDHERLSRYVGMIEQTANRLATLTDDLLDVSRLQQGLLPIRPQQTDLGMLLRTTVDRLQEQSPSHHLALKMDGSPSLALIDPDRVEQVVENLLSNAIKYTPDGGEIQVALIQSGTGIELCVRDPGIGLPVEALDRVFEPFGRAPNAIQRNIEGLGLGLYICRQISKQHGGRLWAESEGEGRGTTMRLWLPRLAHVADEEPCVSS